MILSKSKQSFPRHIRPKKRHSCRQNVDKFVLGHFTWQMLPSANTCSYKGWKYFSNWNTETLCWHFVERIKLYRNKNGKFKRIVFHFILVVQRNLANKMLNLNIFYSHSPFSDNGQWVFSTLCSAVSKPAQSTFGCAFRKSLMLSGNDETKKWGGQNFSCRTCANISYRFSNDDKSKIWTLFGEAKPQTYRIITKLSIMTNYMASWTGKLCF